MAALPGPGATPHDLRPLQQSLMALGLSSLGRLEGRDVQRASPWGRVAKVDTCPEKGVKLKRERGLNFPDTPFEADALTDKDLADLDFIALHADAVEYSFVQSARDVALLQHALAQRRDDWRGWPWCSRSRRLTRWLGCPRSSCGRRRANPPP